jgi:hypothetical protein
MSFPTVVKVLLALLPRVVMAARQTTMMSANITAYSTAVGPSSRLRNLASAEVKHANMRFSSSVPLCGKGLMPKPYPTSRPIVMARSLP